MSDRFKRRRLFVMLGGIIMATGMVTQAFAADLTVLIVGSLTASMGLGLFAAVDQALLLDVLPERETDAGRFMAITGFATSIPQSIAPLVASAILLVGVTGDEDSVPDVSVATAAIGDALAELVRLARRRKDRTR